MILVLIAGLSIMLSVVFLFLAFRQGKPIFKIFMVILFSLSILLIIFGFLIIEDALNFKKDFSSKQNLFLLGDGDQLIAGFVLKPAVNKLDSAVKSVSVLRNGSNISEIDSRASVLVSLSDSQFQSHKDSYKEGLLEEISTSYYKLLIVNPVVFEALKDEYFDIGDASLSVSEVLEVLNSQDPKQSLAEKIGVARGVDASVILPQIKWDVRSTLFGMLFAKRIQDGDIHNLFYYFKDGSIRIYPSSIMSRFIKITPESVIDQTMKNVFEGE